MKQVTVKIDSRGRMCVPAQIRKELGITLIIKKTPKGYILTSKQFVDNELRKTNSKPRTGKPEN